MTGFDYFARTMKTPAPRAVPVALKELRTRAGISMNDLALAAGFKGQSSYQRYESEMLFKKAYLPKDLVDKLLPALVGKGRPAIQAEEVLALAGMDAPLVDKQSGRADNLRVAVGRSEPGGLKILGVSVGGSDGFFELNGQTVGYTDRPADLIGVEDAFAVYQVGDSMAPKYEHGQILIVHPGRPVRPGNFVLIELHSGKSMTKRLIRRAGGKFILEQFSPRKELTVDAKEVRAVHKIHSAKELD